MIVDNAKMIDDVRKGLNCSDELKGKLINLLSLQIKTSDSLRQCNRNVKCM